MKRIVLLVSLGFAALAVAVAAIAKSGPDRSLRSTLAPSMPAPTDPQVHGVNPGGVPWQLTRGTVKLESDGKLKVDIRGLVIPTLGTAGPVTSVSASLFCGADTNKTAAATTSTVPLSSKGNGRIEQRITLPATCLAPIVLVNPNGNSAAYIAITGWRS
ncbi:MAG TPA: hypothetical protein VH416_07515 [Gaiellaceae bacterium]